MMVEDRSGAGPQALQSAVYAVMGRAARPRLTQVFSLFEASTPQLYLDIDRTKVELSRRQRGRCVRRTADLSRLHLRHDFNLLGRTFRVLAQADSGYRLDPEDVLKIRVRSASGQQCRSAPSPPCATCRGPIAFPVKISIRPPSSTARRRRAPRQGEAIQLMEKLAAETLPEGNEATSDDVGLPQLRAGKQRSSPSCWRWCLSSSCSAAQFESLTLPRRRTPVIEAIRHIGTMRMTASAAALDSRTEPRARGRQTPPPTRRRRPLCCRPAAVGKPTSSTRSSFPSAASRRRASHELDRLALRGARRRRAVELGGRIEIVTGNAIDPDTSRTVVKEPSGTV